MGARSRWLVTVGGALACFGACWAGLAVERVWDAGVQVGVAAVPLVVVLAVAGAWAERAREGAGQDKGEVGRPTSATVLESPHGQAVGRARDGSLIIGPGVSMPGAVIRLGGAKDPDKEPSADGAGSPGVLVLGDVPQEPAAFQSRSGLLELLEGADGARVSVVFAVTGIRGVGKTQVAAAYARRRIADGWRLVAWVDASDEASVVAGLARVAAVVGVGQPGEDARALGIGVRHWLEADGTRRLVVLDNAGDLDGLRPFLPAGGAAQVVVTSTRRSAAGLGTPVPVDVFTDDEALAFLAERTGLDDGAGARELAGELGFLPLGLAQAAAVIAREHLGYRTYLERLRSVPLAEYLGRVEGDAYPYRVAEAVVLSLRVAEAGDPPGRCAALMGLVSVLAGTGVSRRVLHLAAGIDSRSFLSWWPGRRSRRLLCLVGSGKDGPAGVDAAAGLLTDASLLGFTFDDSVVAHRLVMRVVRERLAAGGGLAAAVAGAVRVLGKLADEIEEAWRDPAGVRELAGHVNALAAHVRGHRDAFIGEMPAGLLRLRLWSGYLLTELGDSTGLAIVAGEPLAADCERLLGTDHPDTLKSRNNLALAYRAAGRTAEAIPVLERTLADCERVLGTDHPLTMTSRSNLALAYQETGRTAEAIPVLERTLADCERVLGTDHPLTMTSRNNLADAYRAAGRTAEAIPLHERTLADCERVLGTDHPLTMTSRSNLALAYQETGRTAEAIPVLERTLADCERVLGTDHPLTMTSRNNLADAYRGCYATLIPSAETSLTTSEGATGQGCRDLTRGGDP